MKISIPVVTRLQDNQDGGYTMYVYNNMDEMLEDHPAADEFEDNPDRKQEIINENDPYGDGYIGEDTIEIEIDGVNKDQDIIIKLAKPLSFHAGQ